MFKQASVFRITAGDLFREDDFQKHTFAPCAATQHKSSGWVPPRGEQHGALVEKVNDQIIVRLLVETKSVPGQAVRDAVAAKVQHIEDTTGRKPGKKERRELQEDTILELLPNAFPRRVAITAWYDQNTGLLVVDSASQSRIDDFITALVKTMQGVTIAYLVTTQTPQACMTKWLLAETPDDWPDNLNVERECILQSSAEDAATVRFNRHNLMTQEVRKHVMEGKLPTQLALNWNGQVAFVLTDAMTLKKVQFLDGVMDVQAADRFDADVALIAGMMGPLLEDLIFALGGEMDTKEQS